MPQNTLSKSLIAVSLVAFCLSAVAATPEPVPHSTIFKLVSDYKILVPVMVNGSGPYEFLVDTGSNRTTIDQKLAKQLGLVRIGEDTVSGVQSNVHTDVLRAGSMELAGKLINGMEVRSQSNMSSLPSKTRGILGEDFLRHFDVLIDYRHRVMVLETLSNALADTLGGERLPIRLEGNFQGNPTPGRLIVSAGADELGAGTLSMLLDSGASSFVVFGGQARLGKDAVRENYSSTSAFSSSEQFTVYQLTLRQLRFGQKALPRVTALAPTDVIGMDSEGLVPTSLFHSIFISHSGRYVILDPTTRPAAAEVASSPTGNTAFALLASKK